jgi:dihydroorotate dehydrogenase
VPDWTYHPFFKPLLFCLPPEEARALTLRLLSIQASTRVGRRLFRLFAPKPPSAEQAVTVFGLRFPSRVGLGPGLDSAATALAVLPMLGAGFVEVGPAGASATRRRFATDPLRLPEQRALVSTRLAAAPSARELSRRIERTPELSAPVGLALSGQGIAEALRAASAASFITLPSSIVDDETTRLTELRRLTEKPLLLRLSPAWSDERLDSIVEQAIAAGLDGCVVAEGLPCPLLEQGELDGPFLERRALSMVKRIHARHGGAFPIVAAGGIETPASALAFLDAGAALIELHAGLVYAGPGLPSRILDAIAKRDERDARRASSPEAAPAEGATTTGAQPLDAEPARLSAEVPDPDAQAARAAAALFGWPLVFVTGLILIASGIFALVLAATIKLLPYDTAFLQMTMTELCDRNACRIVHFMAHDRVSFGGSIISIGTLYAWLAAGPLRRGEPWAFWTLVFSGLIGFGSFLTYLGYGYLDVWHGRATLALIPVFLLGMLRAFGELRGPRGPRSLFRVGAPAFRFSPAGMGRACVSFTAFGMISGGAIIMLVGMTRVFVPTDLEYIGTTIAEIERWNPRLIPLIAHDRAGFGGGLCSTGLVVMALVWRGAMPGARSLWWSLLIAGLIGFATAIGIHPIVGYVSFVHLAPAYLGALVFLIGMKLLHGPMCRVDAGAERFPDL